jgi:Tfp pilus assembly protein FimT
MLAPARNFTSAFTLTETLIVLSLMAFIVQLSFTEGITTYDRENAHFDRILLLSALREARAESMNDVCTNTDSICGATPIDHGVFVSENGLTIFEGSSYANRNISTDQNYSFPGGTKLETTSSDEVTFAAGTGDVSSDDFSNFGGLGNSETYGTSTISIIGVDNRTETIQINSQGAILSSTLSTSV